MKNLSVEEEISLARSEDTSIEVLEELSLSENSIVRNYVAANRNCPMNTLEGFIKELDALMGVTSNPNTPVDVFSEILNLDNGAYKKFISLNPSAPETVLKVLCKSYDKDIKLNIISHPACSIDILTLLANDKEESVRCKVAASKNLTAELFTKLSIDSSADVKLAIAKNENVPTDILELFVIKRNGSSIYNAAKKNLFNRKTKEECCF